MKREQQAVQKAKGKFVPPPDPIFKDRPLLAEALADCWWEDGQPRDPWGLSISYASGLAFCQINDPEVGRSLATTAETLAEALDQLEEVLGRPKLPWRVWGKKKKK